MTQELLISCLIFATYKERVDKLLLVEVVNQFCIYLSIYLSIYIYILYMYIYYILLHTHIYIYIYIYPYIRNDK